MCSTACRAVDDETDQAPAARFELGQWRNQATLRVSGEVDVASVHTFRDALDAIISEAHSPAVVDLSRVTFIDARGVSALVAAHRQVSGTEVTLVLLDPAPSVRRLLEITGLDEHFTVESSGAEKR